MRQVHEQEIQADLFELLCLAASRGGILSLYHQYVTEGNRGLWVWTENENIVGCIGILTTGKGTAELLHLAVSSAYRQKGIASQMIHCMLDTYSLQQLTAETDCEAVQFYRKFGFQIVSLGEKYPGVERFQCQYHRQRGNR